jgi:hypothetical protein
MSERLAALLAVACASLLIAAGYAFACSPKPGDPWFTLSVAVDRNTLPLGFTVSDGRLRSDGRRVCFTAKEGTNLDGLELKWFERFATQVVRGDGRPAYMRLPKPDRVELAIMCIPRRRTAEGRISYKSDGRQSATWWRHVELDPARLEALVKVEPRRKGSVTSELDLYKSAFEDTDCTVSVERIADETSASDAPPTLREHAPLPLTSLAGIARRSTAYPVSVSVLTKDPPVERAFGVVVNCLGSQATLKASVRYALNPTYDPHRRQRSVAFCASHY